MNTPSCCEQTNRIYALKENQCFKIIYVLVCYNVKNIFIECACFVAQGKTRCLYVHVIDILQTQ